MNLQETIREQLHRLSGHDFAAGLAPVAVSAAGVTVVCELTALDQLGCAVERLVGRFEGQSEVTMADLGKRAASLGTRLGYLLERVGPVETDAEAGILQMRSLPPHRADGTTTYYELLVSRGEVTLCRFEKAAGASRRIVPMFVTREVLGRLIADVAAA